MIAEEKIINIRNAAELFNQDLILDLYDEEPEERERLSALMILKAKEFGLQNEFKKVIKAFNKASENLANEYKKESFLKNNGIVLDFDGSGKPLPIVDNFLQILEKDEKFKNIKFNLLTYAPENNGERWLDSDDAEMRRYIEKKYRLHNVQKNDDAFRIVLAKNTYHPIRDLISSFKWDGVSRIYDFLHNWTKCENTEYTREVSRLIFTGGIYRLFKPGCKFDDMPVLIGTKQGEGKSTLVRWLALKDDYFTEITEFEGQRGIEALEGAWICEVSELLALTKIKEQEAVKSYLTRLNDRYRMPFDKRVTDHPRQCLFIGTTNKEQFLTDKTGNRRFLPVKVYQTGYDLFDKEKEIKAYIQQCWAEALFLFKENKLKPYADKSLINTIREQQEKSVEDDYRIGMIEEYISDKNEFCILELWQNALKMGEYTKPSRKDSNELNLILQNFIDFEKQETPKRFINYGVQKYWRRINHPKDAPFCN